MEFIRLDSSAEKRRYVDRVVEWYYRWWGVRDGCRYEQVAETVAHSLNCGDRLPQTFAAIDGGEIVGTACISMSDDLKTRVDIYPWLANVYVDEARRGQGIGRFMLSKIGAVMAEIGLKELYLYTNHVGLYEKFGWRFVEPVNTYREESPVERLYVLNENPVSK